MARIILLNGTSSAGKTTLATTLRERLEPEFCSYASDQLADAGFRPIEPVARSAGRGADCGGVEGKASALSRDLIGHWGGTQIPFGMTTKDAGEAEAGRARAAFTRFRECGEGSGGW